MIVMVWAIQKSVEGQFALRRFFLGLLIAAPILIVWTCGLIDYPRQTKTITAIAFGTAYLAFMIFIVTQYLKNKKKKDAEPAATDNAV